MKKSVTVTKSAESRTLRISAYTFIIVTLLSFVIYSSYSLVPFASGVSAWVILGMSAVAALICFVLAFTRSTNKLSASGWFDTTILAIACTIVTSYAVLLFLIVLVTSFRGLSFDPYTASWLTGILVAAVAYVVYWQGSSLGPRAILGLLTATLLGGAITSMMSTTDPQWWENHFSTLGMYSGTASTFVFNLTLILAGAVIAILAKYLLVTVSSRDVTRWVKWPLIAVGLSLAAVGLFAYDPTAPLQAFLHNTSAALIIVFFIILIIGIHKALPMLSREFMVFSYGCITAVILAYLLFARIGYFSLTASELAVFTIVFAWIIVFAQNIVSLQPSKN